jgi:hypothetical protein
MWSENRKAKSTQSGGRAFYATSSGQFSVLLLVYYVRVRVIIT